MTVINLLGVSTTHASVAYEAIRHDILACKLKPGQRLRSEVMKVEYGAGVSTIREALSRLAAEGLVQLIDQRGARVAPVSEADLRDLLRVREHVETLALEWSTRAGDAEWEGRVVSDFHMLARSLKRGSGNLSDDDEVQARHEAFHISLVAACGSPRLLQWIQTLYSQTRRYRLIADYGRAWDSDVAARTVDLALANLARLAVDDAS